MLQEEMKFLLSIGSEVYHRNTAIIINTDPVLHLTETTTYKNNIHIYELVSVKQCQ